MDYVLFVFWLIFSIFVRLFKDWVCVFFGGFCCYSILSGVDIVIGDICRSWGCEWGFVGNWGCGWGVVVLFWLVWFVCGWCEMVVDVMDGFDVVWLC